MRVTSQTFPSVLVDQLRDLAVRQNRLQSQAATGQRVQFPSDDPTAMRRVLDLQSEATTIRQYRDNIKSLQELTNVNYDVIRGLKGISDRAGEIATMADDFSSQAELDILANEVNQMIQQAVQITNTQHRGEYLFSGTRSDTEPFQMTLDANGLVTAVNYSGNESVASVEIAENVSVSGMVVGVNGAGTGPRGLISDSRSGADFLNHMITLRDNLLAGDTAAISATDLQNLNRDEENFLFHYGTIGAMQARMEVAENVAQKRAFSVESLTSKEADADLAETLVKLNETQNAYQAALQSGATILSQTLLDYLR